MGGHSQLLVEGEVSIHLPLHTTASTSRESFVSVTQQPTLEYARDGIASEERRLSASYLAAGVRMSLLS